MPNTTPKSGVPGVLWVPIQSKWRVIIKRNGKQTQLGTYTDLEEAIVVRKQAESDIPAKDRDITLEQAIQRAKETHNNKYDYSKVHEKWDGISSPTKVEIICPVHGSFFQMIRNHATTGQGCPKCGMLKCQINRTKSSEELASELSFLFPDIEFPGIAEEYINNKSNITGVCPEHGTFQKRVNDMLTRGFACPKCSATVQRSKGEVELATWISEFTEIETSNRTLLDGKEIDCFLPNHNIGIEFNGVYWHSEATGTLPNYHRDKTELASSRGIRLLHFFDTEWLNKPEICQSIILNAINKTPNKMFARKLDVTDVTSKQSRQFCVENHIHGFRGGKYHKALTLDGCIYCLLILAADGELVRFITRKFWQVIGGFSRLLSKVPKPIYSFVDRRLFIGCGYVSCGFSQIGITKPNYWYTKKGSMKLESRQKYQKHKLPKLLSDFDSTKTEVQNMFNHGYSRVFDCGHYKFIMTA